LSCNISLEEAEDEGLDPLELSKQTESNKERKEEKRE